MSQMERTAETRYAVPMGLESARAKLVSLYLELRGDASLDEMADDLDMRLIELCGVLDALEDRDVVSRHGDRYRYAH